MRIGLRFLPQISYSKRFLRPLSSSSSLLCVLLLMCVFTQLVGKRSSKTETGEVQIWVKDCKNLPAIRGAIIDPFVKWYVFWICCTWLNTGVKHNLVLNMFIVPMCHLVIYKLNHWICSDSLTVEIQIFLYCCTPVDGNFLSSFTH